MIDIHSHILPGLDDGARNYKEAMEMAEVAVAGGVTAMVATVHSNQSGRYENYNSFRLHREYSRFKAVLEKEKLPLSLLLGMEIMVSDNLVELIEQRKVISLNHSDYYLIEFPFDTHGDDMTAVLKKVRKIGKVPVVAHPERYYAVMEQPNLVYEWRRSGCIIQINKSSVFRMFGRRAAKTAERLLDHGLVNCIAGDAHETVTRTPGLNDIRKFLEEAYLPEMAVRLLKRNPNRIIHNIKIQDEDYEEIEGRQWFF